MTLKCYKVKNIFYFICVMPLAGLVDLDNYSYIFYFSVQELSKLSTYGGNDSIVAFARNHGVNIVIHQLNEPRWVIYGADYCMSGQVHELHISYHNGEHYSSVRHISDNSTEPAWIKHSQQTYAAVAMVSSVRCYVSSMIISQRVCGCS